MLGHGELIIIVLVVLILFGATAIPKLARSLGQAKKEFSKAVKETETAGGQELQGSAAADEKAAEKRDGEKA